MFSLTKVGVSIPPEREQCFLEIAFSENLKNSGGLEVVHHEETARHLPFGLFSLPNFLAVGYGRVADVLVKETAERSKTLKSHFETDVRHAQLIATEQLFRFLDATLDQILVRSLIERLPEQTQEVIT